MYDTSKDSDGGAWRKRCQHTSWYNETLNATYRGATKEFPAVAVIVAESSAVTIYDADDPSMPMWMVFDLPEHSVASNWSSTSIGIGGAAFQSSSVSTVKMLNGQLVIGCTSGGGGLGGYLVNFISELMIDMVQYGVATDQFYHKLGNISQRNVSTTVTVPARYSQPQISPKISGSLVFGSVFDVAMTVLPSAPIDPATGLPIPTIAVGTTGGVSVIKDDGEVVDITADVYTVCGNIAFTAEQRLIFSLNAAVTAQRYFHVYDIPSSDISNSKGYEKGNALEFYTARPESSPDLMFQFPLSSATIGQIADYSFGLNRGLAKIEPETFDPASGMVSNITSNYNTGWMNGDIKLAALSDTDDTDVTGGELVV
ncbi:MAG: hypothetical protein GY918_01250, partial [Gammaproteobacteria bacterium]|nr:hypothetical protein [Gammaproteobacteria bacterium]